MKDYWNKVKYFKPEEFISPRDEDATLLDGLTMDETLIKALDFVRKEVGPLKVNSGYRSKKYNREIGSNDSSQHVKKKAADIHIDSQEMGDQIEYWFVDYVGVDCGIGRYNGFLHLDTRGTKARWDNRTK